MVSGGQARVLGGGRAELGRRASHDVHRLEKLVMNVGCNEMEWLGMSWGPVEDNRRPLHNEVDLAVQHTQSTTHTTRMSGRCLNSSQQSSKLRNEGSSRMP